MNYYTDALKRYAQFAGRATRTQYWMYFLINLLISIGFGMLDKALGMGFLAPLYSLAVLIPGIAIGARRLHDSGRSGWWMLISLLPIIGFIILFIFLALPSDGPNDYGPAPGSPAPGHGPADGVI